MMNAMIAFETENSGAIEKLRGNFKRDGPPSIIRPDPPLNETRQAISPKTNTRQDWEVSWTSTATSAPAAKQEGGGCWLR